MSHRLRIAALAALLATPAIAAEPDAIEISHAWLPAPDHVGADAPLYMTITSHQGGDDALLRARCAAAMFVEAHATDYGEGVPAMRAVKSIAIPAGQTVIFAPGHDHVMLLQTTEALAPGTTTNCALVFRNAGTRQITISVAAKDAKAAP